MTAKDSTRTRFVYSLGGPLQPRTINKLRAIAGDWDWDWDWTEVCLTEWNAYG